MNNTSKSIAVIDLGGQYCHMISRRLRDLNVWSDIFGPEVPPDRLKEYSGVILSGGPRSVNELGAPTFDRKILDLDMPVLGICYGHQLLAKMLGGSVESGEKEFGPTSLSVVNDRILFEGADPDFQVWMSHGDTVTELPKGMQVLAKTPRCENAAYGNFESNRFGVQFHPEVIHSEFGANLLDNFARKICKIKTKEQITQQVGHLVKEIQEKVGKNSVFFFVSGGVDSTVAFALCARALPKDRLLGVYVDTGLMRRNETQEFEELLDELQIADRVSVRDEREGFLNALKGVVGPEEKRFIIGREFVKVQEKAMREYGITEEQWLLGQGTIYPDTIESGGKTGKAAVIKTHHNRCAEIVRLMERGRVIEPLVEFYKDEVRHLGAALGIDRKLTQRWPFPGPGLAVRCLCSSEQDKKSSKYPLARKFKRFKGSEFPVSTVGVQGDGRTYRAALAVKGPLDYDALQSISSSTCNGSDRFNRVIYLIATKSSDPLSVHTVKADINAKRIAILQAADYIVRTVMSEEDVTDEVWQFPVVLLPLKATDVDGTCIVLRPVNSQDGMTANFARLDSTIVQKIGTRILDEVPEVASVFLDVTDKPPATIEWE